VYPQRALPRSVSRPRLHTSWRVPGALAAAVLAASLPAAPLAAQHFPTDAEIQTLLDARVEAGGAVGVAVGLIEADGTVRTFHAGSAGEGTRPLDSSTVFEIGSISKVFTGTLLADMARRGEVALDDPVQDYLPDGVTIPSRGGVQITLQDLSTHRSGLPRLPLNLRPADLSNPYADYTPKMMYDFLSGYELRRDVDAQFEYSNLGTGLLGFVLARHLGMDYETLLRSRILGPLGMDASGIALTPGMEAAMARGHNPAGAIVPLWDLPTLAGAGAIRSTIDDMVRFLDANLGEPTTELERAMRAAHEPRADATGGQRIGLNWLTRTDGQSRVVWHNGGTAGFRTFAGFDPDAGVGAVVLTNSGIGADDIGFHLLNPAIPLAQPGEGGGR
jgi:CubicO group peptidase (beta-lactamase class C family)